MLISNRESCNRFWMRKSTRIDRRITRRIFNAKDRCDSEWILTIPTSLWLAPTQFAYRENKYSFYESLPFYFIARRNVVICANSLSTMKDSSIVVEYIEVFQTHAMYIRRALNGCCYATPKDGPRNSSVTDSIGA